jgi:hypothetical protein
MRKKYTFAKELTANVSCILQLLQKKVVYGVSMKEEKYDFFAGAPLSPTTRKFPRRLSCPAR